MKLWVQDPGYEVPIQKHTPTGLLTQVASDPQDPGFMGGAPHPFPYPCPTVASPGLDFPVQAPPNPVTERWKGERQSFKRRWVWLMLGSRFRIT